MRVILIFLCCLIVGSCVALAQDSTFSSPLVPGKRAKPSRLGVVLGPSFHMQDGTLYSRCGDRFTGGASTGYTIGAMYRRYTLNPSLSYGIRLTYEYRNLTAVFNAYELIEDIPSSTPGQTFQESILFRNEADVGLSLLSVTPYVEWSPFWNAFAHLGLMPQFVLSSHVTHTKSAAQETLTLDNGEVLYISHTGENPDQDIVEDGTLPDVPAFQLGVAAGVGIDIPISKTIILTPLYQYVVPLTTLSERGQSFKIRASQLLLAATIEL